MNPDEAVQWMKKNGVLTLKMTDGLEIHLDQEALQSTRPVPAADALDGPPMNVPGSAGMTRQEQLDLYGTVFEADFEPAKPRKKR